MSIRATLRAIARFARAVRLVSILMLVPLVVASAQVRESQTNLTKEFQESLTKLPEPSSLTTRASIYVPAYSSILAGSRRTRIPLATTLKIHNASNQKPLVIDSIDYFDTAGKLIERFLDGPVAVRPFGTIEIFISADDKRGGSGANFVVSWAANAPIAEPIIETVMIGSVGTTSYSFVSQGRAIAEEDER